MKNDKRPIQEDDRIFDQFYNMKSVQSTTEMTGLTPTPPMSEDEEESYSEIQGMPMSTKKRNK